MRHLFPVLAFYLASACAARPPLRQGSPVSVRELEAKTIELANEQPHFDFVAGERRLRAGEGRWKIPETGPGWNRMYGWGPVVWVTENGRTRVLDLRAEFPSSYVSQVYDGETSGKIFLFIEYGIEGPSPTYAVWISEDRGEHWFRGADLPRPPGSYPPSSLDSFFLEASGHGEAWLKLEVPQRDPAKHGNAPAGADVYFRITTPDGGRTWIAETSPAFHSVVHGEPELH